MQVAGKDHQRARDAQDLWVFGYGSLMWKPGFRFVSAKLARVSGYHRSFCIYSTHHRGNARRPGLVLGLDRGGVCDGVLYHVAASDRVATQSYLREREQVNGVYREALVNVLEHGCEPRVHTATAYVVEVAHPSYAGVLSPASQAHLMRAARGISGANLDYLINTLERLDELGIHEPGLKRVLALAGPFFARPQAALVRAAGQAIAVDRARAGVRALCASLQGLAVTAPVMRPLERKRFVYRRQLHARATSG